MIYLIVQFKVNTPNFSCKTNLNDNVSTSTIEFVYSGKYCEFFILFLCMLLSRLLEEQYIVINSCLQIKFSNRYCEWHAF